MIRLNANGSADASFATGTGFDNSVLTILFQNDGKILVGGYFLNYNNTTVNGIVRLNTNGSIDLAGAGCNGAVFAMALQNDGKLLLGGTFTTFGGVTANSIVRLNTDGTVDTTYNTGTGFLGPIRRMVLQPDGKLLAIGTFTKINGSDSRLITRINTDGTQDTSFLVGTVFNSSTQAINLLSNGRIMVGGQFNFYNNISGSCLVKLNADGTKDTSYNPSLFVTNSQVKTIAAQTDGKIIVGGNFNSYFGAASNRIARLNKSDGTLDTSFQIGTGFTGNVNVLAIQTDGKIIAGGAFTYFNNVLTNRIIRLNTDGSVDTSFNVGTGFDASVDALKIQSDGKIVIGGNFTTYNGTTAKRIIRLNTDGSIDTSFVYGTGFNANVWSIVIQTDGKIVIGGDFSGYKGVTSYRIIRLNSDGSKDSTFTTGTGFGGSVYSLVQQFDGKIIASGAFAGFNSNNTARIVRLNTDGTLDSSFNTGSGFDGNVQTIDFQSNGKVVVGGAFSNYNGSVANKICRLNSNGSIDTTFIVGSGLNNTVWSLALQEDATMFNSAKIIVGGDFWSCDAVFSNRLVRLNGDSLLGTQTFNNASFSIAPNPVAKVLFLKNDSKPQIEKVIIYDLTGKVVLSQITNINQVNVESLTSGFYIIEAVSGADKFTSRLIKE